MLVSYGEPLVLTHGISVQLKIDGTEFIKAGLVCDEDKICVIAGIVWLILDEDLGIVPDCASVHIGVLIGREIHDDTVEINASVTEP